MGTGHNTIGAEALAAGAARGQVAAVLVAVGTAHRALAADEFSGHAIYTQMGAALAGSTGGAGFLTGVADVISADGAAAAVFGAGPLSARPAIDAAPLAVLIPADRAVVHSTALT